MSLSSALLEACYPAIVPGHLLAERVFRFLGKPSQRASELEAARVEPAAAGLHNPPESARIGQERSNSRHFRGTFPVLVLEHQSKAQKQLHYSRCASGQAGGV